MREGRDGPGTQHLEGGLRAPTRRILHLGAGAREAKILDKQLAPERFEARTLWQNAW